MGEIALSLSETELIEPDDPYYERALSGPSFWKTIVDNSNGNGNLIVNIKQITFPRMRKETKPIKSVVIISEEIFNIFIKLEHPITIPSTGQAYFKPGDLVIRLKND